jgi:hypothetical protein
MMNLLIWPGTGLTLRQVSVFAATAIDTTTDSLTFFPRLFRNLFGQSTRRRERQADRLAAVSRIEISPRRLVAYQEDTFTFSALATDSLGRTIQGVRFSWESANPDKVQIDDTGRATFLQPGLTSIICRAGLVEASRQVLIRQGRRPVQTDEEWRQDQSTFNPTGSISPPADQTLIASLLTEHLAAPEPQITALGIADYFNRSHVLPRLLAGLIEARLTEPTSERRVAVTTAGLKPAAAPLAQNGGGGGNDFAYDELWSEPRNLVGSPRNRVTDQSCIGAVMPEGSNFHLAIPIVSIPGRGLNGGITLHYNSRVWGRRASTITFDPVASWPSPGFSLGFGRIVTYDTQYSGPNLYRTKYMLIDPDGTRHYLGQSAPGDWYGGVSGETTDGYHITFSGYWNFFSIKYNDGTLVSFSRINNRLLPNWIQDTNGNYVTITYKDGSDQYDQQGNWFTYPPAAIDYITDALGRQIQFNYTTQPGVRQLVSITKPGFGGTSQNPVSQTVVEFQYENKSLSNSFSGLTVQNFPWSLSVLRRVVFPATGTGYIFSHSAYGMIYSYSLRRAMMNGGSVTDGTQSASLSFNYPTVASSLTDAPSFSQRTESATSSPTAVYSYSSSIDSVAQTQTFTITRPDNTQLLLTRSTNTSSPSNGLLVQTEIKSGSTTYAKSVLSYANDPGNSPQVQSVTSYDDANTPTKVDFDYDQYGNVTNRREYGHQISGAWQVRRRTRTTYKTDSAYINANLRSLPILIEVLDAKLDTNDSNDDPIAKTSFTYDDYNAMGGMENYGGTASPPGHTGAGTSHTVRGNVTGTTEWTDVVANTSITHLKKYDIFGNMVEEEVSCCNERSYTLTETNYRSQAEEMIDGSGTSTPLMNTSEYDFNTGATENQTDLAI